MFFRFRKKLSGGAILGRIRFYEYTVAPPFSIVGKDKLKNRDTNIRIIPEITKLFY